MRRKEKPSAPMDQYRKDIGEHQNKVATKFEKREDRVEKKVGKRELQEGSQVIFGLLAVVLLSIFFIFLYIFSS